MPVAPVDLDRITSDGLDPDWRDVRGYAVRREQSVTAPLVDTVRTAAGESKGADIDQALDTVGPDDRERARISLFDFTWKLAFVFSHVERL